MGQNQQWSIIMLMIAVIIVLIAILSVYRFQPEKSFIDDEPEERSEEKQKKGDYSKKNIIIIILSIFTVVVLGFYYIFREDVSNGKSDTTYMVAFIPILVAIFIPILLKQKSQSAIISRRQKRFLIIAMSLVFLVGSFLLVWFIQHFFG